MESETAEARQRICHALDGRDHNGYHMLSHPTYQGAFCDCGRMVRDKNTLCTGREPSIIFYYGHSNLFGFVTFILWALF